MSNTNIPFACGICCKNVVSNAIECTLCKCWVHLKCANLRKRYLKDFVGNTTWLCNNCCTVFPFSSVQNDELTYISNKENSGFSHKTCLLTKCQELNTVNYEHLYSNTDDVDIGHKMNCNAFTSNYYTDEQFRDNFHSHHGLSILSLNVRSLKKKTLEV